MSEDSSISAIITSKKRKIQIGFASNPQGTSNQLPPNPSKLSNTSPKVDNFIDDFPFLPSNFDSDKLEPHIPAPPTSRTAKPSQVFSPRQLKVNEKPPGSAPNNLSRTSNSSKISNESSSNDPTRPSTHIGSRVPGTPQTTHFETLDETLKYSYLNQTFEVGRPSTSSHSSRNSPRPLPQATTQSVSASNPLTSRLTANSTTNPHLVTSNANLIASKVNNFNNSVPLSQETSNNSPRAPKPPKSSSSSTPFSPRSKSNSTSVIQNISPVSYPLHTSSSDPNIEAKKDFTNDEPKIHAPLVKQFIKRDNSDPSGWNQLLRLSKPIRNFPPLDPKDMVPDFTKMELEDAIRFLLASHDNPNEITVEFLHLAYKHDIVKNSRQNFYDLVILEQPGFPNSGNVWLNHNQKYLNQNLENLLPRHKLVKLSLRGLLTYEDENDRGELISLQDFFLEKEQYNFLKTGRYFGLFKEMKAFYAWKLYTQSNYVNKMKRKLFKQTFFYDQSLVEILKLISSTAYDLEMNTELFYFHNQVGTLDINVFFHKQFDWLEKISLVIWEKVYNLGEKITSKYNEYTKSERLLKLIQDVKDHHPLKDLISNTEHLSIEWIKLRSMSRLSDNFKSKIKSLLKMAQYRIEAVISSLLENFWLRMKQFIIGIDSNNVIKLNNGKVTWKLNRNLFNESGDLQTFAFNQNILTPKSSFYSEIAHINNFADDFSNQKIEDDSLNILTDLVENNNEVTSPNSSMKSNSPQIPSSNVYDTSKGINLLQNHYNYEIQTNHNAKTHEIFQIDENWQKPRLNLCLNVSLFIEEKQINLEDWLNFYNIDKLKCNVVPNKVSFMTYVHSLCGELGKLLEGIPVLKSHRIKNEVFIIENDTIKVKEGDEEAEESQEEDEKPETKNLINYDLNLGDLQNTSSSNYFTFLVMNPIYNSKNAYSLAVDAIRLFQLSYIEAASIEYYLIKFIEIVRKLWSLSPINLAKQLERSYNLVKIKSYILYPENSEEINRSIIRDKRKLVAYTHAQEYLRKLPKFLKYFYDLKHRSGMISSFKSVLKQLKYYIYIQDYYLFSRIPSSFSVRCSIFVDFLKKTEESFKIASINKPNSIESARRMSRTKPGIQANEEQITIHEESKSNPKSSDDDADDSGNFDEEDEEEDEEVEFLDDSSKKETSSNKEYEKEVRIAINKIIRKTQKNIEKLNNSPYPMSPLIKLLTQIKSFDEVKEPYEIELQSIIQIKGIIDSYNVKFSMLNSQSIFSSQNNSVQPPQDPSTIISDPEFKEVADAVNVYSGKAKKNMNEQITPEKCFHLFTDNIQSLLSTVTNSRSLLLSHISEIKDSVFLNKQHLKQRIADQINIIKLINFNYDNKNSYKLNKIMNEIGKIVNQLRQCVDKNISSQDLLFEASNIIGSSNNIIESKEIDRFYDMDDLQDLYLNRCEVWQVISICSNIKLQLNATRLNNHESIADLNKKFVNVYKLYKKLETNLIKFEENYPIISQLRKVISEVKPKVEMISYLSSKDLNVRHWKWLLENVLSNCNLHLIFSGIELITIYDISKVSIPNRKKLVSGTIDMKDGAISLGNLNRINSIEFLNRNLLKHLRKIRFITSEAVMEGVVSKSLNTIDTSLKSALIQVSHLWLKDIRLREKVVVELSQIMNLTPLRVMSRYCWKALNIIENTCQDMNLTIFDMKLDFYKDIIIKLDRFLEYYREIQYLWYYLLPIVKYSTNGELERDTIRSFNLVTEDMKKVELALLQKSGNLFMSLGSSSSNSSTGQDLNNVESMRNNLFNVLEDSHSLVQSLLDAYPRLSLMPYHIITKLLKLWFLGPHLEIQEVSNCISILFNGVGKIYSSLLIGEYSGQFGCNGFLSENKIESVTFLNPIPFSIPIEEFLRRFEIEIRKTMEKSCDTIALHRINCLKALIQDKNVKHIVGNMENLFNIRFDHLRSMVSQNINFTNQCYLLMNQISFNEDVWLALGHPTSSFLLIRPDIIDQRSRFKYEWHNSIAKNITVVKENIKNMILWYNEVTGFNMLKPYVKSNYNGNLKNKLKVLISNFIIQEINFLQSLEELSLCNTIDSALECWAGKYQLNFIYEPDDRFKHCPIEINLGNISLSYGFEYIEGGYSTLYPREMELAIGRVLSSSFSFHGSTFVQTTKNSIFSSILEKNFNENEVSNLSHLIPKLFNDISITSKDIANMLGKLSITLSNPSISSNIRFFLARLVYLDAVGSIDFKSIEQPSLELFVQTTQQFWSAIENKNDQYIQDSLKFPLKSKFNRNEVQNDRRKLNLNDLRSTITLKKQQKNYISLIFIGFASETEFISNSVFDLFFRGIFDSISLKSSHFLDIFGTILTSRGYLFGVELKNCFLKTIITILKGEGEFGKLENLNELKEAVLLVLSTSTLKQIINESTNSLVLYSLSRFCLEKSDVFNRILYDKSSRFRLETITFCSILWYYIQQECLNKILPLDILKIRDLFFKEYLFHLQFVSSDEEILTFLNQLPTQLPTLKNSLKNTIMKSAKVNSYLSSPTFINNCGILVDNLLNKTNSPVYLLLGENGVGKSAIRSTSLITVNYLQKVFSINKDLHFLYPLKQVFLTESGPIIAKYAAKTILYFFQIIVKDKKIRQAEEALMEAMNGGETQTEASNPPQPTSAETQSAQIPRNLIAEYHLKVRSKGENKTSIIYHASLSLDSLFGCFDSQNKWTDGILLKKIRHLYEKNSNGSALKMQSLLESTSYLEQEKAKKKGIIPKSKASFTLYYFIVLKGPLNYHIEQILHGIYLQNNKATTTSILTAPNVCPNLLDSTLISNNGESYNNLTFPTGEFVPLPSNVKIIVETSDLSNASPSLLSSVSVQIVKSSYEECYKRIITIWLRSIAHWLGDFSPWISILDELNDILNRSKFIEDLLHSELNSKNPIISVINSKLSSFLRIFEELLYNVQDFALQSATFSIPDDHGDDITDTSDDSDEEENEKKKMNQILSDSSESESEDEENLDEVDVMDELESGLAQSLKQFVNTINKGHKEVGTKLSKGFKKFKFYGIMNLSPKDRELLIKRFRISFFYAALWGFGGALNSTDKRKSFESMLKDTFNNLYLSEESEDPLELPNEISFFECILDMEKGVLTPAYEYDPRNILNVLHNPGLTDKQKEVNLYAELMYKPNKIHPHIYFRTPNIRSMDYILRLLISSGSNFILFGSKNSGKTMILKDLLDNLKEKCPTPDDMRKFIVQNLVNIVNEASKVEGIFHAIELLNKLLLKSTKASIISDYDDDFNQYYRKLGSDLKELWSGSSRYHYANKTISSSYMTISGISTASQLRTWFSREFSSETPFILETSRFTHGVAFIDDMHYMNLTTPEMKENENIKIIPDFDRPEELLRGILDSYPPFAIKRDITIRNILTMGFHYGSNTSEFKYQQQSIPIMHREGTSDLRIQLAQSSDYVMQGINLIGAATGHFEDVVKHNNELSKIVSNFIPLSIPCFTTNELHVALVAGAQVTLSSLSNQFSPELFTSNLRSEISDLSRITFVACSKLVSTQDIYFTSSLERTIRAVSLTLDPSFVSYFCNTLRLGSLHIANSSDLLNLYIHEWRRTLLDPLPYGSQRTRITDILCELLNTLDEKQWRIKRDVMETYKKSLTSNIDNVWTNTSLFARSDLTLNTNLYSNFNSALLSPVQNTNEKSTIDPNLLSPIQTTNTNSDISSSLMSPLQVNTTTSASNSTFLSPQTTSYNNNKTFSFPDAAQIDPIAEAKNPVSIEVMEYNEEENYLKSLLRQYVPIELNKELFAEFISSGTFNISDRNYAPPLTFDRIEEEFGSINKTICVKEFLTNDDIKSLLHPLTLSLLMKIIRILTLSNKHLVLSGYSGTSRRISLIIASKICHLTPYYYSTKDIVGVSESTLNPKFLQIPNFKEFLKRLALKAVGLSSAITSENVYEYQIETYDTSLPSFIPAGQVYYHPETPEKILAIIDNAQQLCEEERKYLLNMIQSFDPTSLFDDTEILGIYEAFRRNMKLTEHNFDIESPSEELSLFEFELDSQASIRPMNSTKSIVSQVSLPPPSSPLKSPTKVSNEKKLAEIAASSNVNGTVQKPVVTGYMFSWVRKRLINAVKTQLQFALVVEFSRSLEMPLDISLDPQVILNTLSKIAQVNVPEPSSGISTPTQSYRRYSMLSNRKLESSSRSNSIKNSYNPFIHFNEINDLLSENDILGSGLKYNSLNAKENLDNNIFTCPILGPIINQEFSFIWYEIDYCDTVQAVCSLMMKNEQFSYDFINTLKPTPILLSLKSLSPKLTSNNPFQSIRYFNIIVEGNHTRFNDLKVFSNVEQYGIFNSFYLTKKLNSSSFANSNSTTTNFFNSLSDILPTRNNSDQYSQEKLLTDVDIRISYYIEEIKALLPHTLTLPLPCDAVFLNQSVFTYGAETLARRSSDLAMYILTTCGRELLEAKQIYEKLKNGYNESLFALNNSDEVDSKLEKHSQELQNLIELVKVKLDEEQADFEKVGNKYKETIEYETEAFFAEDIYNNLLVLDSKINIGNSFINQLKQSLRHFSYSDWSAFREIFQVKPYPKEIIDCMRAIMVLINYSPKLVKLDKSTKSEQVQSIKMDDEMVARCSVSLLMKPQEFLNQLFAVQAGNLSQNQFNAVRIINTLLNSTRSKFLVEDLYTEEEQINDFNLHFPPNKDDPNLIYDNIRRLLLGFDIHYTYCQFIKKQKDKIDEIINGPYLEIVNSNKDLKRNMINKHKNRLADLNVQIAILSDNLIENKKKSETIERNRLRKKELTHSLNGSLEFITLELNRINKSLSTFVSDVVTIITILFRCGWLPDNYRQECTDLIRQDLKNHGVTVSDSPLTFGNLLDRLQVRKWIQYTENSLIKDIPSINSLSFLYFSPMYSFVIDPDGSAFGAIFESVPDTYDFFSISALKFSLTLFEHWSDQCLCNSQGLFLVIQDTQSGISEDLIYFLSSQLNLDEELEAKAFEYNIQNSEKDEKWKNKPKILHFNKFLFKKNSSLSIAIPNKLKVILISSQPPVINSNGESYPLPAICMDSFTVIHWASSLTSQQFYIDKSPIENALGLDNAIDFVPLSRMAIKLVRSINPQLLEKIQEFNLNIITESNKLIEFENNFNSVILTWMIQDYERMFSQMQGLQISTESLEQSSVKLSILTSDEIIDMLLRTILIRENLKNSIYKNLTRFREYLFLLGQYEELFPMSVEFLRVSASILPQECYSPAALSSHALINNFIPTFVKNSIDLNQFIRLPSSLLSYYRTYQAICLIQKKFRRKRFERLYPKEAAAESAKLSQTPAPNPPSQKKTTPQSLTSLRRSSLKQAMLIKNQSVTTTTSSNISNKNQSQFLAIQFSKFDDERDVGLILTSKIKASSVANYCLISLRSLLLKEMIKYIQLNIRPGFEIILKFILMICSYGHNEDNYLPTDEIRAFVYTYLESKDYKFKRFCHYVPINSAISLTINYSTSTVEVTAEKKDTSETEEYIPGGVSMKHRLTAYRINGSELLPLINKKEEEIEEEKIKKIKLILKNLLEVGSGIPEGMLLNGKNLYWKLKSNSYKIPHYNNLIKFYGDINFSLIENVDKLNKKRVSGDSFELEWLKIKGLHVFSILNPVALQAFGASFEVIEDIKRSRKSIQIINKMTTVEENKLAKKRKASIQANKNVSDTKSRRKSSIMNPALTHSKSTSNSRKLSTRVSPLLLELSTELQKQTNRAILKPSLVRKNSVQPSNLNTNNLSRKSSTSSISNDDLNYLSHSHTSAFFNSGVEFKDLINNPNAYSKLLVLEVHPSLSTVFRGIVSGINANIHEFIGWKESLLQLESLDIRKLTETELLQLLKTVSSPKLAGTSVISTSLMNSPGSISTKSLRGSRLSIFDNNFSMSQNSLGLWRKGYEFTIIQTWLLLECLWPQSSSNLMDLVFLVTSKYLKKDGYINIYYDEILYDNDQEITNSTPNSPMNFNRKAISRNMSILSSQAIVEGEGEDDDDDIPPPPLSPPPLSEESESDSTNSDDDSSSSSSSSDDDEKASIYSSRSASTLSNLLESQARIQDNVHFLNSWSTLTKFYELSLENYFFNNGPELFEEDYSTNSSVSFSSDCLSYRDFNNWEFVLGEVLGDYSADLDKFVYMKELKNTISGNSLSYFLIPSSSSSQQAIFTEKIRDYTLESNKYVPIIYCNSIDHIDKSKISSIIHNLLHSFTHNISNSSAPQAPSNLQISSEEKQLLHTNLLEIIRLIKNSISSNDKHNNKIVLNMLDIKTIMGNSVLYSCYFPSNLHVFSHFMNKNENKFGINQLEEKKSEEDEEDDDEDKKVEAEEKDKPKEKSSKEEMLENELSLKELRLQQLKEMILDIYKNFKKYNNPFVITSSFISTFSASSLIKLDMKSHTNHSSMIISSPWNISSSSSSSITTLTDKYYPSFNLLNSNFIWLPRYFSIDLIKRFSTLPQVQLTRTIDINAIQKLTLSIKMKEAPSMPESLGIFFEGLESSLIWVNNSIKSIMTTKISRRIRAELENLNDIELRIVACLINLWELLQYLNCFHYQEEIQFLNKTSISEEQWSKALNRLQLWQISRLLLKIRELLKIEWNSTSAAALLSQDAFMASIQSIVETFSIDETNLYTYSTKVTKKETNNTLLVENLKEKKKISTSFVNNFNELSLEEQSNIIKSCLNSNITSLNSSMMKQKVQNSRQKKLFLERLEASQANNSSAAIDPSILNSVAPGNIRAQKQWKRTIRRLNEAKDDYLNFLGRVENFSADEFSNFTLFSLIQDKEKKVIDKKVESEFVMNLFTIFGHYLAEIIATKLRNEAIISLKNNIEVNESTSSTSSTNPASHRFSTRMNISTQISSTIKNQEDTNASDSASTSPSRSNAGRNSSAFGFARQSIIRKIDLMCGSLLPNDLLNGAVKWTYLGTLDKEVQGPLESNL